MHYLEECLIESQDENHEVFMMKTVWLSYLHLSNILLNWIEFLSRVVESSFSIQFELLNSTSQFNSTLFQKNFNSTQHFLSWILDLNSNTWLNAISLSLFKWTCNENVYVSTFSISMFTFLKTLITWYNA